MKTRKRNPFSTTAIRPGEIPFLADDAFVADVVRLWEQSGQSGQIIGPHGVGKTTLAIAIEEKVSNRFSCTRRIIVRTGRRCGFCPFWDVDLQRFANQRTHTSGNASSTKRLHSQVRELWIINGMERLNWLQRLLVIGFCKLQKNGLLVTSHRKLAGLKIIGQLTPSLAMFQRIVRHLLTEHQDNGNGRHSLTDETIKQAFSTANGNMRDALMILYDAFDDQVRQKTEKTKPKCRTRFQT